MNMCMNRKMKQRSQDFDVKCKTILLRSVVQIKDALMYSHQENKSRSAVADD